MSYESRILVIDRREHKDHSGNIAWVYAEKIADIKMSVMPKGFEHLFDKKVDYSLYIDNADEPTQTDKYGDTMTYTDCQTVIDCLEELIDSGDNHRRLPILLGLLKGFRKEQWNDLQVVHYGY